MIDILESKVVGTNKETWYKLVGTSEDTKPIGEFPAGTGHTVANGSRFYEVDTEIGYEFKEEGWIAVGQNVRLPDVTVEDNGKVLSVVEGNWDKAQPTNELPDVTEDDNGDVLTVVEGAWNKAKPAKSGVPFFTATRSAGSGLTFTLDNGVTKADVYNYIVANRCPVMICVSRANADSITSFVLSHQTGNGFAFTNIYRGIGSTKNTIYNYFTINNDSTSGNATITQEILNDAT